MNGTERFSIVLTPRDLRSFRAIAIGRVLDSSQLQQVAGFGSRRRVNDRLHRLTGAGLLKRFFIGTAAGGRKALYGLTKRGAGVIGAADYRGLQHSHDELLVANSFVEHQLALNLIWIEIQFRKLPQGRNCVRWQVFTTPFSSTIPLVPDSFFEIQADQQIESYFCEVDLGTEPLKTLARKFDLYLKFAVSGEYTRSFQRPRFKVLVITPSERRMENARVEAAKKTDKLFWFSTFEAIKRDGLWGPIWARPGSDLRHSLL